MRTLTPYTFLRLSCTCLHTAGMWPHDSLVYGCWKLFKNKDIYFRYVLKTLSYIFLLLSTVGISDQLTMMWTRVFYKLEPARSVFFLNTCPQLVGKSKILHCQVVSIALGIHWAIHWTANNNKNTSTGLKYTNQLPRPQEASKSSLFLDLNEVSEAAVQYYSLLSSNAGLKSHCSPPPECYF